MKYLIYKVTSNGLKREFTTKRDALDYARMQRKAGWSATVTDMRSGVMVSERIAKRYAKAAKHHE